jgi:hypothetical protein
MASHFRKHHFRSDLPHWNFQKWCTAGFFDIWKISLDGGVWGVYDDIFRPTRVVHYRRGTRHTYTMHHIVSIPGRRIRDSTIGRITNDASCSALRIAPLLLHLGQTPAFGTTHRTASAISTTTTLNPRQVLHSVFDLQLVLLSCRP